MKGRVTITDPEGRVFLLVKTDLTKGCSCSQCSLFGEGICDSVPCADFDEGDEENYTSHHLRRVWFDSQGRTYLVEKFDFVEKNGCLECDLYNPDPCIDCGQPCFEFDKSLDKGMYILKRHAIPESAETPRRSRNVRMYKTGSE